MTYYPAAGAMRINSTLYYILKDHLGSASVVTNTSGVIVGEQRYYSFGETRLTTGSIFTDKLFTGQREMTGLGIYHYGARFYSPKLGHFLSADTIVPGYANPQNLNRFSYVTNNPLRYTDPTGHMLCADCGGGGGSYTPPPTDNNYCSTHPYACGGGSGGGGGGNNGGSGGGGGGLPMPNPSPGGGGDPPACGQQGVYSPDCPGWHEYTTTNMVCPAMLNCKREEMKDYLSRFAYPGQDPSNPVHILGYFYVTDPWFGVLPESIGPIVSEVSPDGLTITNTTLPGHILYDGKIERHAFQAPNGAWYVTTHGYGNNETHNIVFDPQRPDLDPIKIPVNFAGPNVWGGIPIFNEVDQMMLNYIVENHP